MLVIVAHVLVLARVARRTLALQRQALEQRDGTRVVAPRARDDPRFVDRRAGQIPLGFLVGIHLRTLLPGTPKVPARATRTFFLHKVCVRKVFLVSARASCCSVCSSRNRERLVENDGQFAQAKGVRSPRDSLRLSLTSDFREPFAEARRAPVSDGPSRSMVPSLDWPLIRWGAGMRR